MNTWGANGGVGTGVWSVGLVLLVTGAPGHTQVQTQVPSQVMLSTGATMAPGATVVRVIDDPYSGERWLLLHEEDHTGGPGRLILHTRQQEGLNGGKASRAEKPVRLAVIPVIRAGDRLVVEEHTAVAEARLEAVALGAAATGSILTVRLNIGGRVVRARALAPGRATFATEMPGKETQP